MKTERIEKILKNFKDKKICVIGDVMLDRYIFGEITRISPEAPVPVVLANKEVSALGGAGNVSANITSSGGISYIVSVIGKDHCSQDLLSRFAKSSINPSGVIRLSNRPTTEKTRIIAQNQQVVRIDKESQLDIDSKTEKKLIDFIRAHITGFDGLIISDYAKGTITEVLVREIVSICKKNKKFVICDIKPQHANWYKGVTLVAPNGKEALAIAKTDKILEAGKRISALLKSDVLITLGAKGMTLFKNSYRTSFPTKARAVYDVTGAGDTVMAALALSMASGATLRESVIIANHAAGVVVGKTGTATLTPQELKDSLKNNL